MALVIKYFGQFGECRALYLPGEEKEGMDALETVSGELRGDRLAVLDAVNKPT